VIAFNFGISVNKIDVDTHPVYQLVGPKGPERQNGNLGNLKFSIPAIRVFSMNMGSLSIASLLLLLLLMM